MENPQDNASDRELIAAINGGEHDAFEILYHRYRDWVLNLAWRMTRHHDDSLDVLQETFSYVARKFPGFELTASMTTFLYPAVRNLSIAARRKRHRSLGPGDDVQQIEDTATAAHTPESTSAGSELQEVLSTLSPSHSEILVMRFVDDMTQQEIADALQLPVGTVKSRLHHAVQSVRNSPAILQYLQSPVG